jgi:hypothetical protein
VFDFLGPLASQTDRMQKTISLLAPVLRSRVSFFQSQVRCVLVRAKERIVLPPLTPIAARAGDAAAARSHFSNSSKSRPTRGYGPPATPPLERTSLARS